MSWCILSMTPGAPLEVMRFMTDPRDLLLWSDLDEAIEACEILSQTLHHYRGLACQSRFFPVEVSELPLYNLAGEGR